MNVKQWKAFFEEKRSAFITQLPSDDEVDVQISDAEEISQSMQIKMMADKLARRNKAILLSIENALARIAAGTFGKCEECDDDISEARLKALPGCLICIACAEEEERQKKFYA